MTSLLVQRGNRNKQSTTSKDDDIDDDERRGMLTTGNPAVTTRRSLSRPTKQGIKIKNLVLSVLLIFVALQGFALMILNASFPYVPSPWWTPWEVVLLPLLPLARRDGHFRTKVFQIKWLYWPLTRARRQWLIMMTHRQQQQQQPNDDPIVLYVNVTSGQTQRLPASQLPPVLKNSLRYVAVADSHLLHHDVILPAGDVSVHAGDVLVQGNRHRSKHFTALRQDVGRWLRVQQEQGGFRYVLVTGGNHDGPLQEEMPGQVSLFGSDTTTLFVPNGLVQVKTEEEESLATTTQQQIYLSAASRGNPNAANAAFQYTTDTAARQVWSQVHLQTQWYKYS